MTLLFTLTKDVTDRTSNWRFIQTPEGYCAIGGNYKLVSFRSEAAMNKSKNWFMSKGFAII